MLSTLSTEPSAQWHRREHHGSVNRTFIPTRAYRRILDSRAGLVLIAAPTGFGKSALLRAVAHAHEDGGRCVEWHTLASFPRASGVADIIVVDDEHACDGRQLLQIVRKIIADRRNQQVIIASRRLPELDWLAISTAGSADLFRASELALDSEETAAILSQYTDTASSQDFVSKALQWTEGWPIATHWLGQHCVGTDPCRLDAALTKAPKEDLRRYFDNMIWHHIDESMRQFLLDICDFDRFSSQLVKEVLPKAGAQLLARAKSSNLMVLPDSDDGGWDRLHGMFRSFLNDRKVELGIPVDKDRLRTASSWCEDHGAIVDAIDLSLKAGEFPRAHRLILDNIEQLARGTGELQRLLAWVRRLEDSATPVAVPLRLWKCWALILLFELPQAKAEHELIAASIPHDAPPRWRAHLERINLSIAAREDDLPKVVALTNAWIDAWRDREPLHAVAVAVLRSLLHLQLGDRSKARSALAIARQCLTSSHQVATFSKLWVAKAETLFELRSGHISLAKGIILSALATGMASPGVAPHAIASIHLLAARILVEAGDNLEAKQHLAAGQFHKSDSGLVETHIAALEASVLLAEDADGVDAALIVARHGLVPGLRYAFAADLLAIGLQLRHGRTGEAVETFAACLIPHGNGWLHVGTNAILPQHLAIEVEEMQAWLLFAQGDASSALRTARHLLPSAEAQGQTARHVRLLLLAAAASAQASHDTDANRFLVRGLRLAVERGLIRTAMDCGWALQQLLARANEPVGLSNEAHGLLKKIKTNLLWGNDNSICSHDVDKLTNREMELLLLLDSGLTGQAIANNLNLSLATTKWHIQNIYNKLGVRNRSGALSLARRLALIK